MSWRDQKPIDVHSNGLLANVSSQLAALHTKIESLESAIPVLPMSAKPEKVVAELAGLMDMLVIRAENMNESTHEFNDFKKHQQAVNDSIQSTLEELKRHAGLKVPENSETKNDGDTAVREVASLKAKLAESQKSEAKALRDLLQKIAEYDAGQSLYFEAEAEIGRLKSELAAQKKQQQMADAESSSLKSQLADQKKPQLVADAELGRLKSELAALKKRHFDAEAELGTLKSALATQTKQQHDAKAEIKRLNAALAAEQGTYYAYSSEIGRLNSALAAQQKSYRREVMEIARLKSALAEEERCHEAELEETKDLLRKANFACQRKSDEIKNLECTLSRYQCTQGNYYYY